MSVAQTTRESRPEPTKFYRWLVLIFLSLAMFGNYYFYDALEPLAKLLQDQLHFSAQNIGMLQAAYSFPNIFTVVLGGILIDRIGTRKRPADLRRALPDRRIHHRVRRAVPHDGGRPLRLRHGRRVADRRHHHRRREMVQGQGTQLRARHQPDDRARRHLAGAEFSYLGEGRLQLLAKSVAHRRGLRHAVRHRAHRVLDPRGSRREEFVTRARRRAGQDRASPT